MELALLRLELDAISLAGLELLKEAERFLGFDFDPLGNGEAEAKKEEDNGGAWEGEGDEHQIG